MLVMGGEKSSHPNTKIHPEGTNINDGPLLQQNAEQPLKARAAFRGEALSNEKQITDECIPNIPMLSNKANVNCA